jgi:hypothetical protein
VSAAFDDNLLLFGTAEPPAARVALTAGDLVAELVDGALRRVRWRGVELIRGLECLVRDAEWKTETFADVRETLPADEHSFACERSFTTMAGALGGTVSFTGAADGTLTARMRMQVLRDVVVNRVGFVILHPAHRLAGAPLHVVHTDRSTEASRFPELVTPAQPAKDIAGLSYSTGGAVARIAFEGDTFEMEDQRNWTDASFKTYSRPLHLPRPYRLVAGTTVEQVVRVTFSGTVAVEASGGGNSTCRVTGSRRAFPEVALAVTHEWLPAPAQAELLAAADVRRVQVRIPAEIGDGELRAIAEWVDSRGAAVDLEILLADDAYHALEQIAAVERRCGAMNLVPEHVIGLPRAYLLSHQPEGPWPDGIQPDAVAAALSKAFTESRIGGGMLTNFTEFNRRPPMADGCDYVTHGTSAVVHAADDRSVMETLEALPQVFATASALAGGCSYRLGLAAIGMRTNPYGSACAENPEQVRRPMAHADPRQRGLFAAAFAVGILAAAQHGGIESLALAAPTGPFGIVHRAEAWPQPVFDVDPSHRVFPLFHVVRAALRGKRAPALDVAGLPADVTGLGYVTRSKPFLIVANTSDERRRIRFPDAMRVRVLDVESFAAAAADPRWLERSAAVTSRDVEIGPYATMFAELAANG